MYVAPRLGLKPNKVALRPIPPNIYIIPSIGSVNLIICRYLQVGTSYLARFYMYLIGRYIVDR